MNRCRKLVPLAVAALVALFAGCQTARIAEKNLEEGRLVPEAAVAAPDFLNEYRHPLSPPRRAKAGLDIALEQKNVLAQGGRLLAQIGIATAPPAVSPVHVHAVAFAPAKPARDELLRLTRATEALGAEASVASGGSTGKLKEFLSTFARRPFDDGEHHVILLVGSDDTPAASLSERERQDVVDLARILAAKGVTLSVLSFGDKPDFGLLKKLSGAGNGTFDVATESLDFGAWIRKDLQARSAETLAEVEVVATARNGARVMRVLAPQNVRNAGQSVCYAPAELRQGEQRVLVVELEVPARGQHATNEILDVELRYRVPSENRYYEARETLAIRYVDDRNLALPRANALVNRSLLILETQETLLSVAREIRNRRNYQAIALLTKQSRALQKAGEKGHDVELLRDATILAKYAERLYDFDGDWFRSVKIWQDLSWDSSRFRNAYR